MTLGGYLYSVFWKFVVGYVWYRSLLFRRRHWADLCFCTRIRLQIVHAHFFQHKGQGAGDHRACADKKALQKPDRLPSDE